MMQDGKETAIAVAKNTGKVGDQVVGLTSRFRLSAVPRHLFASSGSASNCTIWDLPEELLVYLLKGLHVGDILSMRSVHPALRDIIDASSGIWQFASFDDAWPSVWNIEHFEKAAKHRNIEALLKLGMAYLYNEGLPHDVEGNRMASYSMMAASMFCELETLTPKVVPFTWLFVRPPWSSGSSCCKECVFRNMLLYVKQHNDPSVALCVSQILGLFDDPESQTRMFRYLTQAASGGSSPAMYSLWCYKYHNKVCDRAMELQSVRELRDIAALGDQEVQLALCRYYATAQYSDADFLRNCGVSRATAAATVRSFMESAKNTIANQLYSTHPDISDPVRYIVVDWLAEVTGMKEFSSHTLHVAVSVVDRFLRVHRVSRCRLQLLAVSAMVLCSRFLGKDIITIREAAWLTDNTYRYEDVVRMMGELAATLRGKIRVMTCLDYLYVLEDLAMVDNQTKYLSEYACEVTLLHAELCRRDRAKLAATCLFWARLVLKKDCPWLPQLEEFSGFNAFNLTKSVVDLHTICFVNPMITLSEIGDHKMDAVKQRYCSEEFACVGLLELPKWEVMCSSLLGVNKNVLMSAESLSKHRQQWIYVTFHNVEKPSENGPETPRKEEESAAGHSDNASLPNEVPLAVGSVENSTDNNTGGMEESAVNEADGSAGFQEQSAVIDHNANLMAVEDSNKSDVPSTSSDVPSTSSDVPSTSSDVPSTSSDVISLSSMTIRRRSSDEKLSPGSSDGTPLLSSDISDHSAPKEILTPNVDKDEVHDVSGRHNIPGDPLINSDSEPMQESPIKSPSDGSPMKID